MSVPPSQAVPALIVEDGTNVANANSYISLAGALAYFASIGDESFASKTPLQQSAALVRATYGLDSWLNGRWRGRKANVGYAQSGVTTPQSLDWPRCGVVDSDGQLVPNNVVPVKVQQAQCLVAKIELTTSFIQYSVTRDNSVDSKKIGPIETKYKNTAPSITYWPQVIALLRDYATIGVMPIEVVIGLSRREMEGMRRDRHGFGLNPFDFPDFFHLIKEPIYNPNLQPGWWDSWWLM